MQKALRVEARQRGNNVTKAYRALALVHHPDKGDNAEDFRALVVAYNRLKRQRAAGGGVGDGDGARAMEMEANDDGPSEYERHGPSCSSACAAASSRSLWRTAR